MQKNNSKKRKAPESKKEETPQKNMVSKKVESKKVESKKVESKKVESKKVESKKVESKKVESKKESKPAPKQTGEKNKQKAKSPVNKANGKPHPGLEDAETSSQKEEKEPRAKKVKKTKTPQKQTKMEELQTNPDVDEQGEQPAVTKKVKKTKGTPGKSAQTAEVEKTPDNDSQPSKSAKKVKKAPEAEMNNDMAMEQDETEEHQIQEEEQQQEQKQQKQKEEVTFQSLGLCQALCKATQLLGWTAPTEIQRQALPYAFADRDIIGLAETGSGKTGAFALPILQSLLEQPQPLAALVLSPTRELAFQISEQFEALGASINLRTATIVGGIDMVDQAIALARKPHVIVASPGRLVDHLESTKGFNLRKLRFLVLDEADRLLNMDFEKELDKILEVIPRERRTFLFSATMTSKVEKLQRASLTNPVKIKISKKYQTVKGLIQSYLFIPAKHKDCYLAFILNQLAGNTTIIFTATCENTQRVALMLRNLGFSAIPLHGKMNQPKRLGALNKFKAGQRSILIATDVASRGLDIPSVDLVINFDIPAHSKDYIHRVGRTARAGRSGRAITMVTQYDVELFQRIEQLIGKKMDEYPTDSNQVMLLLERVSEAQRAALMELREGESQQKEHSKKKKKKGKVDKDKEE